MDDLLEMFGLRYEELSQDEKETYHAWLNKMEQTAISVEGIKSHIVFMRRSLDSQLATHSLSPKEDLFLRARLKNYILLEAFFEGPEKAREMLSQQARLTKRSNPLKVSGE